MNRWMKLFVPLVCIVVFQSTLKARAQNNINPRAKEDLNAFAKKLEEGDKLFNEKKYAEAITAISAAHELYMRAERRDRPATWLNMTLKPQTFPAMRYYGYVTGSPDRFGDEMTEPITENYSRLHSAAVLMWRDAAILSDAAQGPLAYAIPEAPLEEITEDRLLSAGDELYSPIRRAELPVPDREWRDVVLAGRRAQLIMEHLLQKYPAWRTGPINWVGQPTGEQVLADIKKKLAEAEPEYRKLVADSAKAEPAGVAENISRYVGELNSAIAGVKRNGWLDWGLARDLFITKDYFTDRRKGFVALYANDGKTMPAGALQPIENKIAELKSTVDKNAPRWKFPAGKPHNAAIEAQVKSQIKGRFPGATIIKTALDSTAWTIQKNDIGLPRYRERDVLALVKLPGQKWPWLISGSYNQTYTGGGTFSSSGAFSLGSNYAYARMQSAR